MAWNIKWERVIMHYQIKKRIVFLAALGIFLLLLGGMETSLAVSEAINNEAIETYKQWPMASWYGLSFVLALIGYIKAKSKSE
jgi:ABC-type spermidine/putrescine transport system permease subunit I